MKVILSESVSGEWREVWKGVVDIDAGADEKTITDRAFDVVLFNYIGGYFPQGFGLRMVPEPTSETANVVTRILHCSGRNVKINYKDGGAVLKDESVRDREFRMDIIK